MNLNEFEQQRRVQRATSVMEAQSNELALDTLFIAVASKKYNYTGLDFRDLQRILEDARRGKRVDGRALYLATSSLDKVGLVVYHRETKAIPVIEPTDLGLASLEAYKRYEEMLAGSFTDYGTEVLRDSMSEPDARKISEDLLQWSFDPDEAKLNKLDRGFCKYPAILKILSEQSSNPKLGILFGLSKVVRPPDSLAVLGEVKQEDVLDGLPQCDLVQIKEDGIEITPLGEASLRAFNAYYGAMESLL